MMNQNHGYGQNMMNQNHGYGQNMMGGMSINGAGMSMMQIYPSNAEPISLEDAEARFEEAAQTLGANLQVKDVMVFSNNYYAQIVDEQGLGVAEVLVDRYTGFSYPEAGPNMMWNTSMGTTSSSLNGQARYDQVAAQALAKTFLAGYLPEATIQAGQAFSGYYTFDFGRTSSEGMLSVNAYSGEVWLHTWHGSSLAKTQ